MGGIRRVTLDITDTIIRVRNGVGGMYKQVATMRGMSFLDHITIHRLNTEFRKTFREHWLRAPNFGYPNVKAFEWWSEVTGDTLQPFSLELEKRELSQFAQALYEIFSTAEAYELLPGAKETIEKLSTQLDVVVITNNDSRIRKVLDELIGTEVFKSLIISNEEGMHKPDKRLFCKAVEGTDIRMSQVLHIGDSYFNDYLPAVSLGMQARLVTSGDPLTEVRCDTIKDITHVLELV